MAAGLVGGIRAWMAERVPARPKPRLPFDVLIGQAEYRDVYVRLKETYGKHWAENWPEQTGDTPKGKHS